MAQPIWINKNGRIACEKHIGAYAAAELSLNPSACEIDTPIDHWILLPMVGSYRITCETCNFYNYDKESA